MSKNIQSGDICYLKNGKLIKAGKKTNKKSEIAGIWTNGYTLQVITFWGKKVTIDIPCGLIISGRTMVNVRIET